MSELSVLKQQTEMQLQENRRLCALLQDVCRQNALMMDELQALKREVAAIRPIGHAKERHIAAAIRARAHALCDHYGYDSDRQRLLMGNIIRSELKRGAGVRSMRELPRSGYDSYLCYIELWDDFKAARSLAEAEDD